MPERSEGSSSTKAQREISLIRYVFKNIKRRRLRSGLTIIGIAICIAFFIVLASISTGLKSYLMDELESRKEGQIYMVRIVPFSPAEFNTIQAITEEHFEGLETGYTLEPLIDVPFIRISGAGGFASYVEVYELIGVGQNGSHTHWDKYDFTEELYAGEHLNTIGQTENGIVMGYKLWYNYYSNKSIGDTLDIVPINTTFQTIPWYMHDEYLAGEQNITTENIQKISDVKLIGILADSEGYNWRDYNGYMPLEFMLRTFKYYDVQNDTYYYPEVSLVITDATGFDFDGLEHKYYEAVPMLEGWDNRFELSLDWLRDMERTVSGWFFIIMGIISIVCIIGVSNTMVMSVTERRTELGTLRALGFSRGKVKRLIFTEAIIICLTAYFTALVIGVTVSRYFDHMYDASIQYGGNTIFFAPTEINIAIVLGAAGIAVLFGTLAALYPAHSATKIHPVEALRYG